MKKRQERERPIRSIMDHEYDRYSVGYRSFYCLYVGCRFGRWHDGTPRIVAADHFTGQGRCKCRNQSQAPDDR